MHFWTNYRFVLEPQEKRFRSQHLRIQDTMFIWWQMSFCFTNEPLRSDPLDFYLMYSSPFRLWFRFYPVLPNDGVCWRRLRQMVFFSTFVSHCKAMNAIRQPLVLIRAKFKLVFFLHPLLLTIPALRIINIVIFCMIYLLFSSFYFIFFFLFSSSARWRANLNCCLSNSLLRSGRLAKYTIHWLWHRDRA